MESTVSHMGAFGWRRDGEAWGRMMEGQLLWFLLPQLYLLTSELLCAHFTAALGESLLNSSCYSHIVFFPRPLP